jgi:MSHA biogenesis protein MshI
MKWIGRRQQPGWLALGLAEDHVDIVHVKRAADGPPAIALCSSYLREGSDAATLARVAGHLKLQRYRCTTLLGRDHYQLHHMDAPNVPAEELKSAMRWRARDVIDYPLESATVDVLDIPADPEAPAPDHKVYVVTARNEAIRKCVEPFQQSRIPLQAIDIAELAQRNVAALFASDVHGVATLAFYDDEGLLTLTRAGELYSARHIDISLKQLLETDIARRATHFERIALEVQRSLDHLGRQYHYIPIAKLLLGPLPAEVDLEAYLGAIIGIPVEGMDLSKVMDMSATPELADPASQSRYLPAIGAALREQEDVAA